MGGSGDRMVEGQVEAGRGSTRTVEERHKVWREVDCVQGQVGRRENWRKGE